ncbi:hypothetical protein GUJ93_ZPchr0006g45927 [Zizania palustris]|uniref:Cysteine proteinase inhibitor n=1 Tax=Zizania palustris TaxID=103762 RepID=A0A8J5VJV5_ZIZPA|nr:hypothetical protein GUJ93_ZPchr0006g45927 [Zizania palustris]
MRTRFPLLLVAAAAAAVAAAFAATAAAKRPADGWTPIRSIGLPHFQQFGQWVADDLGAPMRFYRVVSGRRQNADGINYQFTVVMGNRDGVMDKYKVKVHVTVESALLHPMADQEEEGLH